MRQKGFTLVELLLAMAVGSMLLTGVVLSIHQVVWGTGRTNSQVVALTDVNYAALAIKKDLMMAQSTDLTDGDPILQSSVVLSWTDYTGFEPEDARNHHSTYALSGTELLRTYDSIVSIVGRHITSLGFTQDGRVVNVVITATGPRAPQRSETLKFSVHMRTEGVE